MHFGIDAEVSREVRELDAREPLPIESLVDGVCRKMRAWVGVTSAIDRLGLSRMRARIDIVSEGLMEIISQTDLVALWREHAHDRQYHDLVSNNLQASSWQFDRRKAEQ